MLFWFGVWCDQDSTLEPPRREEADDVEETNFWGFAFDVKSVVMRKRIGYCSWCIHDASSGLSTLGASDLVEVQVPAG